MSKTTSNPAEKVLKGFRNLVRNDKLVLSLLAIGIGAIGGLGVIGLLTLIEAFQLLFFHDGSERLLPGLEALQWWHIVLAPTIGGLAVGGFIHAFMPNQRPEGVANVIEASALQGGRMSLTTGFKAAFVSALSIGSGASVGREGPAVHLGASLAGYIGQKLHLTRSMVRTMLGCGVAAAVAASFNAPIAGALFATEVVIGHYALSAFAPVVIASVVGTAISRAYFGDFPAFVLPDQTITSYWEFPAFVLLGILAGVLAIALIKSTEIAQKNAEKLPIPAWARPAVGGFLVGLMALGLPYVLGVGYGTTELALNGQLGLSLLVFICVGKLIATAISIGFGFGGGVFSPALVIGASLGGAYGTFVTLAFPDLSSGATAYTLIGMGAMAAAVLGAPISTVLIIFEMTANYPLTVAVMVSVVIATIVSHQMHGQSFFSWQLARRGINLREGVETALLKGVRVGDLELEELVLVESSTCLPEIRELLRRCKSNEIFVVHPAGDLYGTITLADLSEVAYDGSFDSVLNADDVARRRPPLLTMDDTLDKALKVMRDSGEHFIAVIENMDSKMPVGGIHERDVMAAYSNVLLETRREEHDHI